MIPLSTLRSEKPLFQLYVQRSLKSSYIEKIVAQNTTELHLSLLSAHVARDVGICVSLMFNTSVHVKVNLFIIKPAQMLKCLTTILKKKSNTFCTNV